MTKSALPKHLDEAKEWDGTDWDTWLQRPLLKIKHWFAFGPRAKERWARWREFPMVLFAVRGRGNWRFEDTDGSSQYKDVEGSKSIFFENNLHKHAVGGMQLGYLSTIQYWAKWHIAVQWPFHFTAHVYFKEPPEFQEKPKDDHRMVFVRFGARRDADMVYWFPSLFVGATWN